MTYKLMIKTHNTTGLKYLCKTELEGKAYAKYPGSGTYWKKHLKIHGKNITTELIFETENKEEFVKYARAKSIEFDVVRSDNWANLRLEEGDGGAVTPSKD